MSFYDKDATGAFSALFPIVKGWETYILIACQLGIVLSQTMKQFAYLLMFPQKTGVGGKGTEWIIMVEIYFPLVCECLPMMLCLS